MTPDIVFEESRVEYLLDLFDKYEDDEGYIVDANTDERVTPEGSDKPIKVEELGVVGRGSQLFVKNDVDSIVEFVNTHEPNSD